MIFSCSSLVKRGFERAPTDDYGPSYARAHPGLGYRRDSYRPMQESDVFVPLPWYEGMATVFLEARAVGVPRVMSDIPASRDMIQDTHCALTFNPASSGEMADRLTFFFRISGPLEHH